jgi:hypothetical protein
VHAHISLFPHYCLSSKLSAIRKNTETREKLLAGMRETTEVAECVPDFAQKNPAFSSTVIPYLWVKVLSKIERNF